MQTRFVTGVFRTRSAAENAVDAILKVGYAGPDISLVMADETHRREFARGAVSRDLGTHAAEGAGIGGAVGGALGAVLAAIAAVGANLVVPGIGLVVSGPITAALAGAGAGAATGGLLGALVGAGVPEHEARHAEAELRQGSMLLAVAPRSEPDVELLRQLMENAGALTVQTRRGTTPERITEEA